MSLLHRPVAQYNRSTDRRPQQRTAHEPRTLRPVFQMRRVQCLAIGSLLASLCNDLRNLGLAYLVSSVRSTRSSLPGVRLWGAMSVAPPRRCHGRPASSPRRRIGPSRLLSHADFALRVRDELIGLRDRPESTTFAGTFRRRLLVHHSISNGRWQSSRSNNMQAGTRLDSTARPAAALQGGPALSRAHGPRALVVRGFCLSA